MRAPAWDAASALRYLRQPVHASTLGAFRVLFATCMLWQACIFWDVFDNLRRTKMVFPYAGLDVAPPCDPTVGGRLLWVIMGAGLATMLGAATKLATAVLCATFVYLFHITEENHNNHYILICHVTFVASFIDWGRCHSIDAAVARWLQRGRPNVHAEPTVPYYQLLLMQLLFTIPYFFGAVAKANEDWLLRAEPPKMWFSQRPAEGVLGPLYHTSWYPWFIAWGGFAFDLGISFILFSRPLKLPIGLPSVVFFNCMNKCMFNIGVFPVAMLASYTLFLSPEAPAKFVWRIRALLDHGGVAQTTDAFAYVGPRWHAFWFVPAPPDVYANAKRHTGWVAKGVGGDVEALPPPLVSSDAAERPALRKLFPLVFTLSFAVFHVASPLRHFALYAPSPSWHEEGHIGAWHMMLRSKRGDIMLDFVSWEENGALQQHHRVFPSYDEFLNNRQRRKLFSKPHAVLLYVQHMARMYREAGRNLTAVYATSCFALNNRAPAKLFVEGADLLQWVHRYEATWPLGVRTGVGSGGFLHPLPPVDSSEATACDPLSVGGVPLSLRETLTMSSVHRKLHEEAGVEIFEDGDVVHVPTGSMMYTTRWHLPPR